MTPWTVAHQAPLSMGFPRQEYWSGWPFPSPGDSPGIEPVSPALQADSHAFCSKKGGGGKEGKKDSGYLWERKRSASGKEETV